MVEIDGVVFTISHEALHLYRTVSFNRRFMSTCRDGGLTFYVRDKEVPIVAHMYI